MTIVAMTADHVAQVAGLEALCFPDPWSEKSVASELENPLALWLVALENDTVVGYVGSTGVSTGPHLHFEVWASGSRIDPEQFFSGLSFSENAGI